MKKNLYIAALAFASLGMLPSCSSDDVIEENGRGVTFAVTLPADILTKTFFGDGTMANELSYIVYVHGDNTPLRIKGAEDGVTGTAYFNSGLTTTVSLDLPRGRKYDIIFMARNSGTKDVYRLDPQTQSFTVDYSKVDQSSEKYDAFVWTEKGLSITGPTQKSITLYRPFAQLNIGTSDLPMVMSTSLNTTATTVTIQKVYDTFNFMADSGDNKYTGNVTGDFHEFTFTAIPRPDTSIWEFPYQPETYKYLSMNYVLVPAGKEVSRVSFSLVDPAFPGYSFNNVPLQRNHRTNIFGKILTAPADFNVIIKPMFDDPDYDERI